MPPPAAIAELGYTVYATARRVARMDALREQGIQTASLDVTDDASMVALTEKIIAETGRIDVLVNISSIGGKMWEPLGS
jgi:NAD(P)-dependent dehydrogenase (short-subunit alcohol dehydrogenase family)